MTEYTRSLPSWIEGFIEYSQNFVSPLIFRKWAAIVSIGSALERRVFTRTDIGVAYPNLFVLLVAPPGIGKSTVITPIRNLWMATKILKVAPNNMTKAALLDILEAAKTFHTLKSGKILEYHSLQVASSEFGVFCPAHDTEFLNVLNDIYDCGPNFREARRSRKTQIDIINPQISIIAGTQPDYLAELLPPVAWGQGFMSRMIMIYSDELKHVPLFSGIEENEQLYQHLIKDLTHISSLIGQVTWEEQAKKEITAWQAGGCKPLPDHFKLKHYSTRRLLHVIKLSMVSSVSRNSNLIITVENVQEALSWLIEAESFMPEIFKSMSGKSDMDTIRELQLYVAAEFKRTGKPLHQAQIISYLSAKTPGYNVLKIFELCIQSGLIVKIAGKDIYRPGAGYLDASLV